MKKYFYIGLSFILLVSLSIIIYGAYLNSRGENIIATRMDNRFISLKGQYVQRRDIQPLLILDTIKLYSDKMADAVALVDGRLVDSYVKRNDTVKAGASMFVLRNEEIPLRITQADSDILKAKVELKHAKNTYDRYSKLMSMNATSAEKLDEVEAAYNAASANVKNLQAQKDQLLVQKSRQIVTAPIDGEVLLLYRKPGSYVTAGTAIALVGDFHRLYLEQTMNDNDINSLFFGNKLQLVFQGSNLQKAYDTDYASGNSGDKAEFNAKIVQITPDISQPASIRKILLEIDNSAGILEPQSYRNVELKVERTISCLSVPLSAMLTPEHHSVFVFTPEETIEQRDVVTGVDDGEYIEIKSGLSEGDIVITSDTSELKSGMKANVTLEGGH